MNLALPAFVILLALLPGIAGFYGYFAGRFDKKVAGVSGVEELSLYVIISLPIDTAARWVCLWFGYDVNFPVTMLLLAGGNLAEPASAQVTAAIKQSWDVSVLIYTLILLGAYSIGSFCRRIVWAFRLDTFASLLELKHHWFYVLQGRIKGLPRVVLAYVDVLTSHPEEKSRLYRGIVLDFEISKEGKIDSLTITDARRGSGRGDDFKWKPIPSDQFSIMGSTIHSINVTYVGVDLEPHGTGPRLRYYLRTCWKSFINQEP